MIRNRLLLLIVIASMAVPLCGFAQTAPSAPTTDAPPAAPGQRLNYLRRMLDDLNLTDDQKAKVESAFASTREALRDANARADEVLADLRMQLQSILDPEQQAKLKEKIDQLRNSVGAGDANPDGGRGGGLLDRLKQNLDKLELSDDQKAKLKTLGEETREKFQSIREEAKQDVDKARPKMRALMDDFRSKLGDVLSPEQREKLRDLMSAPKGAEPEAPAAPASQPAEKVSIGPADPQMQPMQMQPMQMQQPMQMGGDNDKATDRKPAVNAAPAPIHTASVRIDEKAPDFQLKTIDAKTVSLSAYSGKFLLIEFGSYSCPSFRERSAAIEQLKRDYGLRMEFLIVYTKEAHPVGGWEVERNHDDGIAIDPAKDIIQRSTAARQARDHLHITIPIALDAMEDAVTDAYGLFPNGAVVIGRDGKIVAVQKWFEPVALRDDLDSAMRR